MEHKASFETKQKLMQLQPILYDEEYSTGNCFSHYSSVYVYIALTHGLNRAECGYQVHRTEGKISQLQYMDGLKLLVRDEDQLQNEIKVVKAIGKDINMNFVLKNCANI